MKNVYGYIRVSTKEQIDGASLPEQKYAIKEFAKKNNLNIIHFYEETKTAAKKGRPFFLEMIENLHQGKASGVIIHKIDRSARNLHDWASIGDLIDNGIEVFFAHESLNMNERGGRLSADIQAVMASDYVRNLRQETIKGLYGRLKQGYYPWMSPIGYIDNGKGKNKTINQSQAELIKQLFKLYVKGGWNVRTLSDEMEKRGLRNKKGNRVCKNSITKILKNPFYIGLMKAKEKTYKGNHKAIIDTRTFKKVQMILKRRVRSTKFVHNHLFRMQVECENCNYIMSGEIQKGHVYYRCRYKTCKTKTVREDHLDEYVMRIFKMIALTKKEILILKELLYEEKNNQFETQNKLKEGLELQQELLDKREKKLLDAYLDNLIDKDEYEIRKKNFLIKNQEIEEQKNTLELSKDAIFKNVEKIVELCESPLKIYISGLKEEKRELLNIVSSNLTIDRKKVMFTMVSPFYELANRDVLFKCALYRDTHRTLTPKIIYSDKNTSPIIPKPLNRKQLKEFFQFLLETATSLHIPDINKYDYEISKDDTCS